MEKFVNIGNDYIETKRAHIKKTGLDSLSSNSCIHVNVDIFRVVECDVTREEILFLFLLLFSLYFIWRFRNVVTRILKGNEIKEDF